MIKKIICPTDFSETANNAVEYAAKIAQVLGAEILFVNAQRLSLVEAVLSLEENPGISGSSIAAANLLKDISDEVTKTFNVSTGYEVEISPKTLAKTFSSYGPENTMIIMGTNGVDDLYQYFFGTNTYAVIQKAKCPVLVVPENAAYQTIQKIVFAWDYSTESTFSFSLLKDFMRVFDPQFVFLHVSKKKNEYKQDVFRAFRGEVESALGRNNNVEFEHVYSEGVSETIDQFMLKSEAEMLALTYYKLGLIPNAFHGKVAKDLIEAAQYPILILQA